MKYAALILSSLFVSGCVEEPMVPRPPTSLDGYCIASAEAVRKHASALANTNDIEVLYTGDLVLTQREAACQEDRR